MLCVVRTALHTLAGCCHLTPSAVTYYIILLSYTLCIACGVHRGGGLVRNLYQLGDVQFADDVDLETSSRTFSCILYGVYK